MRPITRVLTGITAMASLVVAVPAEASTPTIHVRTAGAAVFLDPTEQCPVARASVGLRRGDRPAGRVRACYQSLVPGDGFQVLHGPAYFRLRRGTVRVDTVNVEVF